MKIIDLERAIQEQIGKIVKSEIIPKCRDIAEKLGSGGSTSEEWATAHYCFNDDLINIFYQIYGMGDEELKISCKEERVFEAIEHVTTPPTRPNYVVGIAGRRFEILLYHPGEWEQRMEILYRKLNTDASEGELTNARDLLGISIPK